MNAEKLKKLQEQVRIGGKGTDRRKKKVMFLCANKTVKFCYCTAPAVSI